MSFVMAMLVGFFGCLGVVVTLFASFAFVLAFGILLSVEEWQSWRRGDIANGISGILFLLAIPAIAAILDGITYLCFLVVQKESGTAVGIGFCAGIVGAMFVIANSKYFE